MTDICEDQRSGGEGHDLMAYLRSQPYVDADFELERRVDLPREVDLDS